MGWVCTGVGQEQACLRMASEVIHENLESCKEYYKVVYNELNVPNITISFDCVQAAVLEDVL